MTVSLNKMSPLSRVWIFQSDRFLSIDERSHINEKLTSFLDGWAAHGAALNASFEIVNACAVVVVLDETKQTASGCSITSLTDLFKYFDTAFKLSFFNRFSIAHKSGSSVLLSSVDEFKALIKQGKVTENTFVYNNLVSVKQDLATKWEVPLKNSWHKRYL